MVIFANAASTMTAFTDIRRTNPIQEPQVVTTKQNTFFTQVSFKNMLIVKLHNKCLVATVNLETGVLFPVGSH